MGKTGMLQERCFLFVALSIESYNHRSAVGSRYKQHIGHWEDKKPVGHRLLTLCVERWWRKALQCKAPAEQIPTTASFSFRSCRLCWRGPNTCALL